MTSKFLVIGALLICGYAGTASAATLVVSHTWTGTELLTGPNRIFRDGTPSVTGTLKPFPGLLASDPTYFTTFAFSAVPGTVVTVTPTLETTASFIALYSDPFSPADLAANYVGDQGSSLVDSSFGAIVPLGGQLVLVGMTVNGSGSVGAGFAVNVDYTPQGDVPEPASFALVGLALAGAAARSAMSRILLTRP